MSRKASKGISSLSFSLSRFYRRISTAKPSTLILAIIALAITIFMLGGGLYDVVMKPLPSVYTQSRGFLFLYPQLSEQFISDSIIAATLYVLGVVGLLAIYQSTKYAYRPRQAYMTFLVGALLLFMAYVVLEATIQIKIAG